MKALRNWRWTTLAELVVPDAAPARDPSVIVARSILIHGPISRTEVADQLGLSQPTLTRIVKSLMDSGLVVETGDRIDGVGRPSRPLLVRANGRTFMGVKLTGTEAFATATDLTASEVAAASHPLDDHRPEAVVAVIAELEQRLRTATGRPFEAIGVSLGGSAEDGRRVDRAPFLEWRGVELAELVERATGVATIVENDVTALTAVEHWFGAGRGETDFAVVTIGAGIGLGLVTRDRVVRSRDAGLGLAGHIALDPLGPPCMLGHRGCATAMLTIPSMCAQATLGHGRPVTFEELLEHAASGDPLCSSIVSTAARALGRLIAFVANLSLVDVVVVSGEGIAILDVAEAELADALLENRDADAHPLDVRYDRSDFGSWARGAAAVAIQAALPSVVAEGRATAP